MHLLENISVAIQGLKASKMRALLTMLGIIIGISSVIAIQTIGTAMTGTISDSMNSVGIYNISVEVEERGAVDDGPGSSITVLEKDQIGEDMIDSLLAAYPDSIQSVSFSHNVGVGQIQENGALSNVMVSGVNDGYVPANNLTLLEGRFITEEDKVSNANVAVISDRTASALSLSEASCIGEQIAVDTLDGTLSFTIVGIYEHEVDALFGTAESDEEIRTNLFIPVSTAHVLTGDASTYQSFTVTTVPNTDSAIVSENIQSFFAPLYESNSKYEVTASSMESLVSTFKTMLSTIQLAVTCIAAISLLVGGIGVMNIMLVSVTERTKEIGTRKALGARDSAIRIQFVVEAIIICLLGGLIGVGLGLGLGALISNILGFSAMASVASIVIAVLFSVTIGVFFGYYPANKAAALDPIIALRYE